MPFHSPVIDQNVEFLDEELGCTQTIQSTHFSPRYKSQSCFTRAHEAMDKHAHTRVIPNSGTPAPINGRRNHSNHMVEC